MILLTSVRFRQRLPTPACRQISEIDWDSFSNSRKIFRATGNSYHCSNMDALEELTGNVSRNPHTAVGGRISWKVTTMHPDHRAEFHVVRHRRRSIKETRSYMRAASCI